MVLDFVQNVTLNVDMICNPKLFFVTIYGKKTKHSQ